MAQIKTVGIVGAGTMGQGIAQAVALGGYQVILNDIDAALIAQAITNIDQNLDRGIEKGKLDKNQKDIALSRISSTDDLKQVEADLIIEAVVEDLSIKVEIFKQLEKFNSQETIFVSNTSSIPITHIAECLDRPQRLAGLHFFNPAHIMKLVEVIKAKETSNQTVDILNDFTKSIGKYPAAAADSPGFIVNRVARHYYVESLLVLEESVASHETIDDLLENQGFRMGPFRLMDLIGIDTNFAVTQSLYHSFNKAPKFKPSEIQRAKVVAGQLGRKSGKGFYKYD
jgi:3-hydroxybutyryl-CoA dehydrogenase